MSTTYDSLHMAYFPAEYADILMDVLAIKPDTLLSVKDVLYHFRSLGDDQAQEVIEAIADQLESDEAEEGVIIANATDVTYTPGPWDYDMDFIVAPDPNGRFPDIYIAEIADSDEEGRVASIEQQDANRKLIAAAPELLEALQETLTLLDGCMRNAQRLGQPGFAAMIGTMISVNRTAIANAKGGQP